MKKVILIGDSIRMGYDKFVKSALEGAADVYYTAENCKFAQYVLRFLHEWKEQENWPEDADLIHWNAGLWDNVELFGDAPLTPISVYEEMIARVDKRLRMLFPRAKLVFATSTAVLDDKFDSFFSRSNKTIANYNEAALRALKDTDTVINDLYSLTVDFPEEFHSDPVHFFTDNGVDKIGRKVLSVICNELDISSDDVKIDGFVRENYSKTNIGY